MKLVSIIVPVYNVEKYIKICLDSILVQTYPNLEILLVDDGSTDNSGKICDEYSKIDNRIICFHKENGGLSDARNYGIERAKGDYLSFIDSDDYVDKDFIKILVEKIEKSKANICSCSYIEYYSEEKQIHKYKKNIEKYYENEDAFKYLNVEGYFSDSVCNKLFKKYLFDDIRFPVRKKYEDRRTIYKLIEKSSNIYYFSDPLYYYRQRDNSIIHEEIFDVELIEATKEIYDFVNQKHPSISSFAIQHLLFAYIANYNRLLKSGADTNQIYMESTLYFKNVTFDKLKIFKKIQLYVYITNKKIYDFLYTFLKR